MSHDIGIIIGNRNVRLIGRAPVVFSEGSKVRNIKENHLGAILSKWPDLANRVSGRTRYVLWEDRDPSISEKEVADFVTLIAFSLNFFAVRQGLSLYRAFMFRQIRATRVERSFGMMSGQLPTTSDSSSFALRAGTQPSDIQTPYAKAAHALQVDGNLLLTLGRFNSCLLRDDQREFIIDASICLESMFSSQTEIAFRFALYNLKAPASRRRKKVSYSP
jgi:hypothetical protein